MVERLSHYSGFDTVQATINQARTVLNTPDETKWPIAAETVKTALMSFAIELNIQNCGSITFVGIDPASSITSIPLKYDLRTGELLQKFPSGQKYKLVKNPRALADNADTILPIFKELAIASLPAS